MRAMKRRHADGIRSHYRPWDWWTDYPQATPADVWARRHAFTPEELRELEDLKAWATSLEAEWEAVQSAAVSPGGAR
jgi:hypothetical protein